MNYSYNIHILIISYLVFKTAKLDYNICSFSFYMLNTLHIIFCSYPGDHGLQPSTDNKTTIIENLLNFICQNYWCPNKCNCPTVQAHIAYNHADIPTETCYFILGLTSLQIAWGPSQDFTGSF